ncbi:TolC family protein [Methylobacillus gramineus]|uniref:TolC family protein n=1 Tax=Methylobacillus gramineus TaxID=755169 RepID=UPI001CFF7E4C|nr:TolC family protein [Methylobacillus gramineus]MCB5185930.1 TolC family protein [Methylobacillus gramineus]
MLVVSAAWAAEPQGDQTTAPATPLQAASSAAHAAVQAANAAAVAATAAASAATAAANAASEAVRATEQGMRQPQLVIAPATPEQLAKPPAAPVVAVPNTMQNQPQQAAKLNISPIGLQPLNLDLPTQGQSVAEVRELSLSRLFGVGAIPVAVANEIHNEYLSSEYADNRASDNPANVVDTMDLRGATDAAVDFSRDVHVADERVNQAEAQSKQARALLLPNLSVRYGKGREISSPSSAIDARTGSRMEESTHTRTDRAITLRQPLLDLPSIYDWKRRQAVISSREESRRGSQGDAWLATVNAYLGLTTSRLIADLSLGYENQLNELFSYVDKRANAGASSSADRERVRARSLSARSARTQQEAAHSAASVEFLRLTNMAPQQIQLPDRKDMGVIPETASDAVKIAMNNSPDIASLREELKAAQIDQNVARTRYAPRLDLELSRLTTNNAGGPVGEQDDKRFMVVLNWNLLNGGGDYYMTKEKLSRIEEVRYRVDDLQRRITQAMISQYAILESSREQLVAGYRELNAITSAANSMSEKMFAGNQSLLDLLDVYDRRYQARTRLVTLHAQEIDALSQISRLLGQSQPATSLALGTPGFSAAPAKNAELDEGSTVVTPLTPAEDGAAVPLIKE